MARERESAGGDAGSDLGRRSNVAGAAVVKFALSGFAALVLVGVLGSLILQRIGTNQAIADARQLTTVAGRGIVQPAVTDSLLEGDASSLRRLDRVVRERVVRDPVVRVKIWAPDGRIVYSDEPRLIGSTYRLGTDERAALRTGAVEAGLSDLSAPENRFERSQDQLLEVYLPIHTPDGHPLLFETYLRFSSVVASARRIWLNFLPAPLAALGILAVIQIPLAWTMARRLEQGQRERERLLRRALDASDAERRRIASDLHDGVVQELVGVSFSLAAAAAAEPAPASPRADARNVLRSSADAVRRSVRALRTTLVDIYPPNLDAGLKPAVAELLEAARADGLSANVRVDVDGRLPAEIERVLYRATQEALRNVVAHADATAVDVEIARADGRAVLTVRDDGRGFAPEEATARRAEGHVGLRLLEDLARDSGGRLDLSSTPGRGTAVRLEVPVT